MGAYVIHKRRPPFPSALFMRGWTLSLQPYAVVGPMSALLEKCHQPCIGLWMHNPLSCQLRGAVRVRPVPIVPRVPIRTGDPTGRPKPSTPEARGAVGGRQWARNRLGACTRRKHKCGGVRGWDVTSRRAEGRLPHARYRTKTSWRARVEPVAVQAFDGRRREQVGPGRRAAGRQSRPRGQL